MTYDKWQWRAQNTNGEIPLSKLRVIEPGFFDPDLGQDGVMHPDAARAMSAMLWDATEAGFHQVWPKYTYRTIADQRAKWAAYVARNFAPPIVASPGTSNHGWAVTVDFSWSWEPAIDWIHANCAKYGFKFDVPSENWHCTYQDGDIRPAVLRAEEAMAKVDEIEKGINAFLAGNEPNDEGLARKTYRALDKAAKLPKPDAPGPHEHEIKGVTVT